MKNSIIETIVGFVIIVFAAGFLYYSYNKADKISHSNKYPLIAKFDKIDGINIGSEVKLGGIKIGEVTGRQLEQNTYKAVVTIGIEETIKIPVDSSAQVASEGLLGEKFISVIPGAQDEFLKSNGEIKFTQSSINLETLIGKMIFSKDEAKGNKDKTQDNNQPEKKQ